MLYSSADAVFTYKISKKDVGIRMKSAVAVNPKMFTSIIYLKNNKIVKIYFDDNSLKRLFSHFPF